MIGYTRIIDQSFVWRDSQGALFPLSPPNLLGDFSQDSAVNLLKEKRNYFIRWESDFDLEKETPWWHIIKDEPQSLEELPKKTRYMIRKSEKLYEAKPVTVSDILANGYEVYVQAYARYETHEVMYTESEFLGAIAGLPEQTEWWAVFDRETERMVAFSENYVESSACFYVTMWLEPEAMAKFAGYLLFHKMELHYLQERHFKYVSDGARSLSHDTNIHNFLISKFNFRKAFANLHVVYAPWLGIAVSCAYPFRYLLNKSGWGLFKKASILLKQEEIRRECVKAGSNG